MPDSSYSLKALIHVHSVYCHFHYFLCTQALRAQAQDGWLQRYLAGGRSRYASMLCISKVQKFLFLTLPTAFGFSCWFESFGWLSCPP
jgi:hypothetical protein